MNKRGFGLLAMLAAVLLVGILAMIMLRQYVGHSQKELGKMGLSATEAGGPGNKKNTTPSACNGRRVGNICVPTEVRSASLDAFEQM